MQALYLPPGATLAPDVGLTGNTTPSLTPKPMQLDAANGWFEAGGLPITDYDDAGRKNFYPMVKVTARDATGTVLATTMTVLPVSDEITCVACHASRSATESNAALTAARPQGGWVADPDPEKDWKKNILKLHDEKQAGNADYQLALEDMGLAPGLCYSATLATPKPTLCAGCHGSNALGTTSRPRTAALTSAVHTKHGQVKDPATGTVLDDSTNRSACYLCHPGSVTKCLRGAMGNAVDASGNALMGCQSCHGNMTKVGDPARAGWLQEPTCQACHFNGRRTTSAVDAAGNLSFVPADTRFATNANTPSAGFNLFRSAKVTAACDARHATAPRTPSTRARTTTTTCRASRCRAMPERCANARSVTATPPMSLNGGPHGMHTIGAASVSKHHDMVESGGGTAQCAYCHGSDYRGSPLSQVKAPRSFSIEQAERYVGRPERRLLRLPQRAAPVTDH